MRVYNSYFYTIFIYRCSFVIPELTTTMDEKREKEDTHFITINNRPRIKYIESVDLYNMLSLIAEVGGYVGLFLGISVNQIGSVWNHFTTSKC